MRASERSGWAVRVGGLGPARGPRGARAQDRPLVGRRRSGAAGWAGWPPSTVHVGAARAAASRASGPDGGRGRVLPEPEVGRCRGRRRPPGRPAASASATEVSNRSSRCGDRLVDGGDPGDGDGAGDDQHLVGVVEVAVRLPQRVGLVPAAHVGVDHRHERHRLAGHPRHGQEVRDVGRVDQGGARGRVGGDQQRRAPRPGRRPTRGRRTATRSRPVSAGFSRASACWSRAMNRLRWVTSSQAPSS